MKLTCGKRWRPLSGPSAVSMFWSTTRATCSTRRRCMKPPITIRKLAISGRLGENLSAKEGQQAARIASLNALAAAKQHLGSLDRLKKLVKLTVLIATTERFLEHAPVADGASDLFVQIFGSETGHVRLVYGVQSLPVGAPVIVDCIFEIKPA